ncbi:putative Ig domain-containing protein [Mucilaginibacter paludis]|uniref:Alpha-galactosidase n=1 Tax=Mucilaginibacter paludis DSM 18603 TaxID=714943 RepID=H1YCG5_9SPHI|nr:putative Ig domain-containing protein [Mucilaginibacter paludis]EHQ30643.1 glycoside hydrolase clan GH-D [Mucilaginibacter paludis DSM 18603]
MAKFIIAFIITFNITACLAQNADYIRLDTARFITGDQPEWKNRVFNDHDWKIIKTGEVWQNQGFPDYHGYAWYRIHVRIPSSLKKQAVWGDSLRIYLAHVNDADETYLNGEIIGKTGAFPDDKGGYVSKWPAIRNYAVSANSSVIKWDEDNVIAVKVYDGGGTGGIFMGEPFLDMLEKTDGIAFEAKEIMFLPSGKVLRKLSLQNKFNTTIRGTIHYTINDAAGKKRLRDVNLPVALGPFESKELAIEFPHREGIELVYNYTEQSSGKGKSYTEIAPYILTPRAPLTPVINSAAVLGVKALHPILYRIPVSGSKPINFSIKQLPEGLSLDEKNGIISGSIQANGTYTLLIKASNSLGKYEKSLEIKVGDTLALTPPMGWNSWNCWGLSVSAEKVKSSADAMIQKGLADYGWNYINVDDGWQATGRAGDGEIKANEKFPDMGGLGDYLHQQGLKFGIYSSPGTKTCGGFLGSLGHEGQDAVTYNQWGVDYLKYDLCSYTDVIGNDTSLSVQQKPYMLMRNYLEKQPRDIIYSICQYGIHDVWKWGSSMNGNLWRTTEDITDTWESLYSIGFAQSNFYPYAHPGGWNDPDMLIVGKVGWGENLHASRLTPYEQYTHISLWCLLSAPLLIGCDMSNLDEFTLNLLKNNEVIAVDQDAAGKQAQKMIDKYNFQVWVKQMADGSHVIGIFNLGSSYAGYTLKLTDLGINETASIRDLWAQKNIGNHLRQLIFQIPPHGVRLIKVFAN